MNFDSMNMSVTDTQLREKIAATINEADIKFLEERGLTPREFADALSWEMANCGLITFEEYRDKVFMLCRSLQDDLFQLRQLRLNGDKVKPEYVMCRGMLQLSGERAEAVRHLQWALRTLPTLESAWNVPRYRQAVEFIESLGDEDRPCHICGAKPGEQGKELCSKCSCVNCTWKEGRVVERCPEHADD